MPKLCVENMSDADNFQWLPQLAVSAKLLCLLMVVICGAVPSMVRSVRLYNACSSSDISVDMKGRVLADDNESERFRNLTIRSLGFSGQLQIHAEQSKRILCFNKRWKLVGLLPSRKTKGAMCQFYEKMDSGYNKYSSVANKSYFVGFNPRGRPLRAAIEGTLGAREKCLNFLKRQHDDFSINQHNSKLAGGNQSSEHAPTHTRQHKQPNQNKGSGKLKKNTDRIRHQNHHRDIGKQS